MQKEQSKTSHENVSGGTERAAKHGLSSPARRCQDLPPREAPRPPANQPIIRCVFLQTLPTTQLDSYYQKTALHFKMPKLHLFSSKLNFTHVNSVSVRTAFINSQIQLPPSPPCWVQSRIQLCKNKIPIDFGGFGADLLMSCFSLGLSC